MTKRRRKSDAGPELQKSSPIFLTKIDAAMGIVEAVVSVFGVVDLGRDIITPGAYAKTIVERVGSIRVLDQHQTNSVLNVIGRPLELREIGRDELPPEVTLKFPEATGGLWVKVQFNLKTMNGREVFERLAAGDINEWSIGYDAMDSDFADLMVDGKKVRVRYLRTIKLWEFSPVIWGMNQATTTTVVKSGDAIPDPVPTPDEVSELTPDGPISRMGDEIQALMLSVFTDRVAGYLACGWITPDEQITMMVLGMTKINELRASLPEDLALRVVDYMYYWNNQMAADPDAAAKGAVTATAAQVKLALDLLQKVTLTSVPEVKLDDAPPAVKTDDEAVHDEPPAGPPSDPGDQVPAPTDARKHLEQRAAFIAKRIDIIRSMG